MVTQDSSYLFHAHCGRFRSKIRRQATCRASPERPFANLWDYKNRTCHISMPGYVSNVLSKFQHDSPKHPQHTPSWYVTLVYGTKTQYATKDETPPLTAQQRLTIQKGTGSALYYARAVDTTMLMPLNDIATEQTKATEKTQATTNQMLDYLATHLDATIRCHASDMILNIHSDASYLSVSNARSRLGGLFFPGQQIPRARHTQRIHTQRRSRHQKRRGLSCRIRSWSVFSQRPKCCPAQSHTNRAGSHTTPNASASG
jgi:hypothetical protein